jgi:hypothetical protein
MTKQGLIGAWCPSLGATGFRLLDRSGRGNHGTLTNMASTAWTTSGGKVALNFDGLNDCIEIPNRDYLQSLQVPMTISAWCYKTAGSNGSVVTQYQSTTSSQLIKLAAYGTTEFAYYASTAAGGFQRVAYSTVPALSQWHFLTWVVSGSIASPVCRLGQNGIEQSFSLSALSSAPVTSVPHRIACTFFASSNNEFNSTTLDDIRIYNRALSAPEIRQMYIGGRGYGLLPERPRRRGKAAGAAFNRRRRILTAG